MYSARSDRHEKLSAVKLTAVQYGILVMMLALSAGLWRLQVLGADSFRMLAEQNRVRKEPVLAARGKLFDRENRLVVDNYPSVSCFLIREQGHNLDADLPMIARGLDLDLDQLRLTLRHYRSAPGYQPIPIKQDITADEQAFVEAHRNELPELLTIDEERRLYPRDGFAAQLIGYVGEVSEEMLNDSRYAAYEPGDVVGKSGIEETYDEILRGQDGSRDVIVDSHGREMGYLRTQHAIPGKDLRLTIDNDIQRAAELAMGDRNGAVVAMDPRNGEILAMVSRPSFDPNAFSIRINRADWNKLVTDPDHPLMNKAIQAQLAPGSTFKILMSVAGLEAGIAQNLKVNCNGGANYYGRRFACDARHGAVDIYNAIPDSCDTFYYALADKLGIDRISEYGSKFGFGQKTGIDLPGEQPGLMPSAQWVMKYYHRKWYAGETISVGIGQGAVEATPIQLARIIGGIASDGHMVRPHVVFPDQLPKDFRQALLDSFPGSGQKDIPLDPDAWKIITDGMAQVTEPAAFHTAGSAHLEGIDLAGKTGTAQVVGHDTLSRMTKSRSTYPNAWFIGIVPRRNPEFVVAVLWQNGEFSYYPARIGARIVAAYVDKQRRLANNLAPTSPTTGKPSTAIEVGAVWSVPTPSPGKKHPKPSEEAARIQGGHFFIDPGQFDANGVPLKHPNARQQATAKLGPGPALPRSLHAPSFPLHPAERVGSHKPQQASIRPPQPLPPRPSQLAVALPTWKGNHP
jgi:penicillin-binding protein 2